MFKIAFLTLEDRSAFVIDDELTILELAQRGVEVTEIPWNRPGVDWGAYEAVIIRSTWDYQHSLKAFLRRLEEIEALGVPLANRFSLVKWNAHKSYLRDFERAGIAIVSTTWGRGMTAEELRGLPVRLGVREAVIKPVVGANADDTYRVTEILPDEEAERIAARFSDREWMAQPFIEAVVQEGEYSLFYFNGLYSHAIVKRPQEGDFRVQEEHGGLIEGFEPTTELFEAAEAVLRALKARGEEPLQVRVDLIRYVDGTFRLMELEAIEPSLYFRTSKLAPRNFARAVETYLFNYKEHRDHKEKPILSL